MTIILLQLGLNQTQMVAFHFLNKNLVFILIKLTHKAQKLNYVDLLSSYKYLSLNLKNGFAWHIIVTIS